MVIVLASLASTLANVSQDKAPLARGRPHLHLNSVKLRLKSLSTTAAIAEYFATHNMSSASHCKQFEDWAHVRFGIGPHSWKANLTVTLRGYTRDNCTNCGSTIDKLRELVATKGGLQAWCESHPELRDKRQLGWWGAVMAIGAVADVVSTGMGFASSMGCGVCETISTVAGYVSTGADCVTGQWVACGTGLISDFGGPTIPTISSGGRSVGRTVGRTTGRTTGSTPGRTTGRSGDGFGSAVSGYVRDQAQDYLVDAAGSALGDVLGIGGSSSDAGASSGYSTSSCSDSCQYASDGDCDDGCSWPPQTPKPLHAAATRSDECPLTSLAFPSPCTQRPRG